MNHTSIIKQLSILLPLLCGIGCAKNEEAVNEPSFTNVQLKAVTVDTFRLQVMADDALLTNRLPAPGDTTIPVQYFTPSHRFRVTDLYSNMLLLDTVIDYKPGAGNAITFFQPVSGNKLVWVGPPVNEAPPATGKIKLSIVYGHAKLPGEVKVVVRSSKTDNSGSDFIAVDSFLLRKGEFSKYFTGGRNKKARLTFFTADARRDSIAVISESQFARAVSDFSIYSFNSHQAFSNGVYDLAGNKIY